MHRWLIPFFTFLCLLAIAPDGQAQGDPASEIILLVNQLRVSRGVPAYQVDAALSLAAQAQASWSAANNHIGHDGPGGSSPNDRARAAGYGNGAKTFAVENVASGTASLNTPAFVVSMWQGDWVHLAAMVSPKYEHIGVGYAEAGDNSWYVMMVGWVEEDGSAGEPPQAQETPAGALPGSYPFVISTPDENGAIYHEVQPGQTAWTIAAYYGIDLAALLALNGLAEDSFLQPGDVLLIRSGATPAPTPQLAAAVEVATYAPAVAAVLPTSPSVPTLPGVTAAASSAADGPPTSPVISAVLLIGLGMALAAAAFTRAREIRR